MAKNTKPTASNPQPIAPQKANYIPPSVVMKAEDCYPTMAEAFARWQGLGEYPADCVLCEFVGTGMVVINPNREGGKEALLRPETHRNTATGKLVDPTDWETIQLIQVDGGKKVAPKFFQVFRIAD